MTSPREFEAERKEGHRFAFGANWSSFLKNLTPERIVEAERSIREMLDMESLADRSWLDVGSGSGLFSLAAHRLGARVFSFDFDPASVECARELRRRFTSEDNQNWIVQRGSALDADFVASLGKFDVVYAWGVLHHTGDMWRAIEICAEAVNPGGTYYLMIYPDYGWKTKVWRRVKRTYCSGIIGRSLVLATFIPYYVARGFAADALRFRNPVTRYREYYRRRGMSKWHDWIDWLGGYPFETANRQALADYLGRRGFSLIKQNGPQYVFQRRHAESAPAPGTPPCRPD